MLTELRSRPRLRFFPASLLSLLLAGGGMLLSSNASAQAIDGGFSVQRFHPAPGPRNFVNASGARMDGEWAYSAGLLANYAFEPFVYISCASESECGDNPNSSGPEDFPVVENLATADLLASVTPFPELQLGLRVPLTYVKGHGITGDGEPDSRGGGIDSFALGDTEIEGKYRLHGGIDDEFVIAAALFATAPLGKATAKGSFVGSETPTVGLRGIADGRSGPFAIALNLGGALGGTGRVGTTKVGSEFQYAVAGSYAASSIFTAFAEGFGTTRFSANRGENTLEGLLGIKLFPMSGSLAITAGAGTGLLEGVGVPKVRAFLGVIYISEDQDRDGDGINDSVDDCPTDAEDFDGHEDGDGCPDPDNDLDTIVDSADKCPDKAEDPDGFEDLDGCPDLDNDQDGIPDDHDACPNKPETMNGYKDADGCPDVPDTDEDGIIDSEDQCPNEPEDTDGFQDTDGCPDPDNDQDGIPDNMDECIEEPETINGFEDADGCPDEDPEADN